MGSVEELFIVLYFWLRYSKKRKRRFWMSPKLVELPRMGVFGSFYTNLRVGQDRFVEYTGMSVKSFDELLGIIGNDIRGIDTQFRSCIRPEDKLLVALRYLSSGCTFGDFCKEYLIGRSTARKVTQEVFAALWNRLRHICTQNPSKEEWKTISDGFGRLVQFPNCVGAVSAKQFNIELPSNRSKIERNNSPIVVFANSKMFKSLDLPISEEFSYVFAGDESVNLFRNLMCPYSGSELNHQYKIFNFRLKRA